MFVYWVDAKEKAGLRTVTSKEKPDAAAVAAHILSGQFSMDDYRLAVDNLMAEEGSRSMYGLRGLLKNMNTWINRTPAVELAEEDNTLPPGYGLQEQLRLQGLVNAG